MNKCKEEQLKGGEKEMKDDVTQNFPGEEPTYKKGGKTMKTKMKKLMKNQKGMTLIELLAVIVIIAIIALIAIPAIGNIINNSKDKAILADASSIISGAKIALQDGSCEDKDKCLGTELKGFVEKDTAELTDATFVEKTTDGYKLTYAPLKEMKGKFKDKFSSGTVTSEKLAKAMDGQDITADDTTQNGNQNRN